MVAAADDAPSACREPFNFNPVLSNIEYYLNRRRKRNYAVQTDPLKFNDAPRAMGFSVCRGFCV